MTDAPRLNVPESDEVILIYTTVASLDDARKLGLYLVESRIVACVNIMSPTTSIYRWEQQIEEANETPILIKTRRSLKDATLDMIVKHHPYSVPALIVFSPAEVSAPYRAWVIAETRA